MNTTAKNRQIRFWIIIGIMFVVLGMTLFLFRETEWGRIRTKKDPSFPVDSCVRILHLSRVYDIEPRAGKAQLWFATAEGVRVLNTNLFSWFRYGLDHGLPSETVSAISFAGDVPWLGTWNGIVFQPNDTSGFETIPGVHPLKDARILALIFVPGMGVVCSADGKGLFRIDTTGKTVKPIDIRGVNSTKRITALTRTNSGFYAGIEGGTCIRVQADGNAPVHAVPFHRPLGEKTLIWDIMEWKEDIWIATSDDGIWKTTSQSPDTFVQVSDFPAKGAYTFSPETDGFWCGTPFGLWRYQHDSEVWIQFIHPEEKEPTDFQVFALAGTNDSLWYGSMDLGAGFLTKKNVSWHPMRGGLSRPNVAAMAADNDVLWTSYGYQGGGIDKFFAREAQYDRNYGLYRGIVDPHVQKLLCHDSLVLFGSYTGFGVKKSGQGYFRFFNTDSGLPSPDIKDIVFDAPRNRYLLGSLYGVIRFSPDSIGFDTLPGTGDFRITSLVLWGDSLWFSTLSHGVHLYSLQTSSRVHTLLPEVGSVVTCATVETNRSGRMLFVATRTNGCYRYQPLSASCDSVPLPSSFSPERRYHITAMAVMNDAVWIGTRDAGCFILNPATAAWTSLSTQDGLVTNQVRCFAESSRYIWIGSYGGIARYERSWLQHKCMNGEI